jgi:hypothetical protein
MHSEEIKISQFSNYWKAFDLKAHKIVLFEIKDETLSLLVARWLKQHGAEKYKILDLKKYDVAKWTDDFCHYDLFQNEKSFFINPAEEMPGDVWKMWQKMHGQVVDDVRVLAIQRKKSPLEKIENVSLIKVTPVAFWQTSVLFDAIYELESWSFPKAALQGYWEKRNLNSSQLLQKGRLWQQLWQFNSSNFSAELLELGKSEVLDRFQFIDLFGNRTFKRYYQELSTWLENETDKGEIFGYFSLKRSYLVKMYDLKMGNLVAQNQYEKKALQNAKNFSVKEINEWMIKLSNWEIACKQSNSSLIQIMQNNNLETL